LAAPEREHQGDVRFRNDYLEPYLQEVPVPLALERAVECGILAAQRFERPVLDLGCGDGIFASILFADPIETGVDPLDFELDIARTKGIYEELLCCLGNAIPKPDASYATAFSNSVLEHIADLDPVLVEINRILRPGGMFYVTIPTHRFERYTIGNVVLEAIRAKGLAARWRAMFKRFWNLYNVDHPDRWRARFEAAGFEVVDQFEYEPRNLYLLKEVLMPFSVPGAVSKRVANRWVIVPAFLRRILMRPIVWVGRAAIPGWSRSKKGCLTFMALKKTA
jgi:SAM-dependent methyltransferase